MSRNISWNICRGIATSAIWKATWRPWLTTFAPILIGFSFRLVSDQSLIGWASPACAGNFRGCRRSHEAGGARRWPRTFLHGQPRPLDRALALLDPLLACPAL